MGVGTECVAGIARDEFAALCATFPEQRRLGVHRSSDGIIPRRVRGFLCWVLARGARAPRWERKPNYLPECGLWLESVVLPSALALA